MWRLLLCAAVLWQAEYVHLICMDCAFGMCDTGPQFCDQAKQECVCPPPRQNGSAAELTEPPSHPAIKGCFDCAFGMCDTGPQFCDTVKQECVCPPPHNNTSAANATSHSISDDKMLVLGCFDCGFVMCTTGRQLCDFAKDQCVCPRNGTKL